MASSILHTTRRATHGGMLVLGSLSLHGLLLLGLQAGAEARVEKPLPPVRVTVLTSPPKPVEPPKPELAQDTTSPAQAAPKPALAEAPKPRAKSKKAVQDEPAQAALPPKGAPSEPVDFTGVTLTSPGAGSFNTLTGNGEASSGVLGAVPRGLHGGGGGSRDGLAEVGGPRVVGLASLSRRPRAPDLDLALREHYPPSARDLGRTGRAVVRARIMPDGRVEKTQVLIASAPEFGRACQGTLAGSRWSAPLDERGMPVATDVSYTCEFQVTQ